MKLPLEDGDRFVDSLCRPQKVMGEITDVGTVSVCWTLRGDWFRRADGVEVTGAYRDGNRDPVTIMEYGKLRRARYAEEHQRTRSIKSTA